MCDPPTLSGPRCPRCCCSCSPSSPRPRRGTTPACRCGGCPGNPGLRVRRRFSTFSHKYFCPRQFIFFNVPSLPGGYKISPRPCEVSGVPGTCMFVWECLKTEGQVRTNQNTASGHVTAVLISYWPAPGHVHGRLHVRELLRARHPGQPHPGLGPHHQQGEQQK